MSSKIQSDMTREPVSITGDVSLTDAQEVMRAWGMRHLPVMDGDQLVGILSERDVLRALALHKSPTTLVADVMSKTPYRVTTDASVASVAHVMADNKYGCAIVMDLKGRLAGIFTTTDALNLLARILNEPEEYDFRKIKLQDYFFQRAV